MTQSTPQQQSFNDILNEENGQSNMSYQLLEQQQLKRLCSKSQKDDLIDDD